MNDLHKTIAKLKEKISLLEKGRQELSEIPAKLSEATRAYELKMGTLIATMELGEPVVDAVGRTHTKISATNRRDIAKSLCADEHATLLALELGLKITMRKLDTVQSELNGYQSINKHLDES